MCNGYFRHFIFCAISEVIIEANFVLRKPPKKPDLETKPKVLGWGIFHYKNINQEVNIVSKEIPKEAFGSKTAAMPFFIVTW
jgi:hypothetical protein